MGPVEALKLALSKETEAVETYRKFAQDYPAAKEIFIFLMGQEQNHEQLIQKKIEELTRY